jgi:hypothetical protein
MECEPLNRMTMYVDQIVEEAIEIKLHPRNFNREADFMLSCTWQPVISICKWSTPPPKASLL